MKGKDSVVSVWDMEHGYWVVGLKGFLAPLQKLDISQWWGGEGGGSVRTEHYACSYHIHGGRYGYQYQHQYQYSIQGVAGNDCQGQGLGMAQWQGMPRLGT